MTFARLQAWDALHTALRPALVNALAAAGLRCGPVFLAQDETALPAGALLER